ncbi:hypothetical protein [Streptomyces sp. NPDC058623]
METAEPDDEVAKLLPPLIVAHGQHPRVLRDHHGLLTRREPHA